MKQDMNYLSINIDTRKKKFTKRIYKKQKIYFFIFFIIELYSFYFLFSFMFFFLFQKKWGVKKKESLQNKGLSRFDGHLFSLWIGVYTRGILGTT